MHPPKQHDPSFGGAAAMPATAARSVSDLLVLAVECGLVRMSEVMDTDLQDALESFAKRLLSTSPPGQALGHCRLAFTAGASQAAFDVLAERQRQISTEGCTPEHDDKHEPGELAQAAACYALFSLAWPNAGRPPDSWPWDSEWWKPKGIRSGLVRAGALILAELDRLDRAAAQAPARGAT